MGRDHRAYREVKDFLPTGVKALLDIGCGGGTFTERLANHYPDAEIHVIDGDQWVKPIGKEQLGFIQDATPWNDRNVAVNLIKKMCRNPVVKGYPPDPSLTIPVDLIVSTKSWGHHYSINVYIDLVKRSLREGGRIILDIRNDRENGLKILRGHGFKVIAEIAANIKTRRVALERI